MKEAFVIYFNLFFMCKLLPAQKSHHLPGALLRSSDGAQACRSLLVQCKHPVKWKFNFERYLFISTFWKYWCWLIITCSKVSSSSSCSLTLPWWWLWWPSSNGPVGRSWKGKLIVRRLLFYIKMLILTKTSFEVLSSSTGSPMLPWCWWRL